MKIIIVTRHPVNPSPTSRYRVLWWSTAMAWLNKGSVRTRSLRPKKPETNTHLRPSLTLSEFNIRVRNPITFVFVGFYFSRAEYSTIRSNILQKTCFHNNYRIQHNKYDRTYVVHVPVVKFVAERTFRDRIIITMFARRNILLGSFRDRARPVCG